MRVLEWFSGIGGCAAALSSEDEVVLAYDHDEFAHAVYSDWWDHPALRRNVAALRPDKVPEADLWWMSPPCQPYTIRGRQKDLEDRRSGAFLRLLELLDAHRPAHIGLENVPWFEGSQAHARLLEWLEATGYQVWQGMMCPADLGIPMIRRRFFLVASRENEVVTPELIQQSRTLADYLGPGDADTRIDADVRERFADALHIVRADDPAAIAACFTGAYARSPVYAGSYLQDGETLRLFAPREILALQGFPARCVLPELTRRKAYKLVGNSLSVDCTRAVLSALGPKRS